ncbi:hypothetical protein A0H81_08550 [Grifola frondosa]|uniref:Uncharacterized protein n=1 Tax=Grifola frondosa TaxID=5627 RepID=A0A1C7M3C2_GRIFR|nr:hypothetical protein A0H81_08550 [Grifola frondosa]
MIRSCSLASSMCTVSSMYWIVFVFAPVFSCPGRGGGFNHELSFCDVRSKTWSCRHVELHNVHHESGLLHPTARASSATVKVAVVVDTLFKNAESKVEVVVRKEPWILLHVGKEGLMGTMRENFEALIYCNKALAQAVPVRT